MDKKVVRLNLIAAFDPKQTATILHRTAAPYWKRTDENHF